MSYKLSLEIKDLTKLKADEIAEMLYSCLFKKVFLEDIEIKIIEPRTPIGNAYQSGTEWAYPDP